MTRYAENVKGSNNQKFQHFISDSQWDTVPIIAQLQKDVTDLIEDKSTVQFTLMNPVSRKKE